jgi:hypothetical protein
VEGDPVINGFSAASLLRRELLLLGAERLAALHPRESDVSEPEADQGVLRLVARVAKARQHRDRIGERLVRLVQPAHVAQRVSVGTCASARLRCVSAVRNSSGSPL